MSIEENLKSILFEIQNMKNKAGREYEEVELLAVSKTKPVSSLIEAYRCGQRLFGENRLNEAEIKVPALPSDTIFHMIGHLQSNKVKKACELFDCIQSVDSLKIANKINNHSRDLNKIMDVYLEVNIANDDNKSGFVLDDNFTETVKKIVNLENINIVGLMCIGAHVSDTMEVKNSFIKLKELSIKLMNDLPGFNGNKLSMGMSSDYPLAIEAGSTMVRVGSSIFGSREK